MMAKRQGRAITSVAVVAVLWGLGSVSCGGDNTVVNVSSGEWRHVDIGGKQSYIEIRNSEEEASIGLVSGERFVLGIYVGLNRIETFHTMEGPDGEVTIKDLDGDGLPDVRVVRDRHSGKVKTDKIVIGYEEARNE